MDYWDDIQAGRAAEHESGWKRTHCRNNHRDPDADCNCADLAQERIPDEEPYDYCATCGECIGMDEDGQCEPCWMREHPRAVSR